MKTKTIFKSILSLALGLGISLTGQGQTSFVNDNCVFTLPAGTKLVLSGGTGLINQNNGQIVNKGDIFVSGDWANSGVADIDEGTVHFNGNGSIQNVSGNTDFNYVNVVAPASVKMISGTQAVKSILKCDGSLYSDGHLTLLSTATQTALIDGDGFGNIYGSVTQQRYIPAAKMKGYKHYSSAFSDATFGQFGAFMNLALGTINDNPYPTIFKFSEASAVPYFGNGWVAAAPKGQTGNIIAAGQGYTVQMGTASNQPKVTSLSGTVNNGNVNVTLTKTYSTNASGNGWNLIGNPYPSPVDLSKLPYFASNINNSVSFFNSTSMYNGYYGYYNSLTGWVIGDGSKLLPALHAVFVQKKTLGTNNLTFTNTMRSKVLNPTMFKNDDITVDYPAIKLSSAINTPNSIADETVIMFKNDATSEIDSDYDASKILNTDPMIPNLSSISNNGTYAINALPNTLTESTVIPLGFQVQTTGEYTINASDILNIPSNMSVYLEDLANSKIQDLTMSPSYTFTASKEEQPAGRFFLRFAPTSTDIETTSNSEIYQAWATNNTLYVSYNNPTGLQGKLKVMNVLGQQIMQEQNINNGMYQFNINQPAGYYLVNFTNENTTKTSKIFINK